MARARDSPAFGGEPWPSAAVRSVTRGATRTGSRGPPPLSEVIKKRDARRDSDGEPWPSAAVKSVTRGATLSFCLFVSLSVIFLCVSASASMSLSLSVSLCL